MVLTELGDARGSARFWLVDLDATPESDSAQTLDEPERARAARFVFERDRRRYVAAHAALRHLLAARTDRHPASLSFEQGPFGKPHLAGTPSCAFNLSHSQHLALVAICDAGEIGVDMELLRAVPDAHALASGNFTPAERASLAGAHGPERDLLFLWGWTRKEACLKAIGCGLSVRPDSFEVGLTAQPRRVAIQAPHGEVHVHVESFRHEATTLWAWARMLPSSSEHP